ncbi:Spexin [Dissostichus eleginoides]|uniref:Spexin n=1 Tax=Dissostichus eleginoides TaxID=100907 RepID=A0AAD9CJY1_DISEL|nr:Spexin [Dissostichus eleginoides]
MCVLFQERKATVVWTCTLVLSLFLESCHTQKLNVHWGPQSMMYLKGKRIQRLPSQDFSKTSHIVSLEKVLVSYLQRR